MVHQLVLQQLADVLVRAAVLQPDVQGRRGGYEFIRGVLEGVGMC